MTLLFVSCIQVIVHSRAYPMHCEEVINTNNTHVRSMTITKT